jgi:hypothetical protein
LVLRGRRLDRRYSNRAAGFLQIAGRRRRPGMFALQRPPLSTLPDAGLPDAGLPDATLPDLGHPQLTDDADPAGAGQSAAPMVTLPPRPQGDRMHETPILHRALYLTSDAIVLTLASPFLAVWWIVRAVRRRW